MGKTLLIMRHGEAEGTSPGVNDFQRPLTNNGINEVTRAGFFMNTKGMKPNLILHSSAVRTSITAEVMAQVMKLPFDKLQASSDIYNASLGAVLEAISQASNSAEILMVVGHNPTLSYLTEYYTNGPISYLNTAHIACITFEATEWRALAKGSGRLAWLYEGPV